MRVSIERYTFEDSEGREDGYSTMDMGEARDYARAGRLRLIAHVYEWADSEVVEDYTQAESADEGDTKSVQDGGGHAGNV
jgi:hypothetical protein